MIPSETRMERQVSHRHASSSGSSGIHAPATMGSNNKPQSSSKRLPPNSPCLQVLWMTLLHISWMSFSVEKYRVWMLFFCSGIWWAYLSRNCSKWPSSSSMLELLPHCGCLSLLTNNTLVTNPASIFPVSLMKQKWHQFWMISVNQRFSSLDPRTTDAVFKFTRFWALCAYP